MPDGVETLTEARIQRQRHRIGSYPRFRNNPNRLRYLQLEKTGPLVLLNFISNTPTPVRCHFFFTSGRDTAPHSVGTQPPGPRLIGSARVRG